MSRLRGAHKRRPFSGFFKMTCCVFHYLAEKRHCQRQSLTIWGEALFTEKVMGYYPLDIWLYVDAGDLSSHGGYLQQWSQIWSMFVSLFNPFLLTGSSVLDIGWGTHLNHPKYRDDYNLAIFFLSSWDILKPFAKSGVRIIFLDISWLKRWEKALN